MEMKVVDIVNKYLRGEKGEHEYIVVYVDSAKVISYSKVFATSLESAVCKYEFTGKTVLGAFQNSGEGRHAIDIAESVCDYGTISIDSSAPVYDLRKLYWDFLERRTRDDAKKPRHS
jgi:hypothetical protein